MFYGRLVHLGVIWYIFPVLVCCTEKNLATRFHRVSHMLSSLDVSRRQIVIDKKVLIKNVICAAESQYCCQYITITEPHVKLKIRLKLQQ
jgi:hypothetical protein